jgi:hypothetical protein
MRCRILVYATYSYVQLVPRDVVFRQLLVGRFTAHVYIRNSEFADVIPANEGPMHIDGNPHPLRVGLSLITICLCYLNIMLMDGMKHLLPHS